MRSDFEIDSFWGRPSFESAFLVIRYVVGHNVDEHGNLYKISGRRLFRQQLRRWLGYRPRATMPQPPRTPTKGHWAWLSVAERKQIDLLTRQGCSAREIGKFIKRDRRTVDRARLRIANAVRAGFPSHKADLTDTPSEP